VNDSNTCTSSAAPRRDSKPYPTRPGTVPFVPPPLISALPYMHIHKHHDQQHAPKIVSRRPDTARTEKEGKQNLGRAGGPTAPPCLVSQEEKDETSRQQTTRRPPDAVESRRSRAHKTGRHVVIAGGFVYTVL
jgi:hypothetical protein